jgi:mannose-6-phosphate isomerase
VWPDWITPGQSTPPNPAEPCEKRWRRGEVFTLVNGSSEGKLLFVNTGESLSPAVPSLDETTPRLRQIELQSSAARQPHVHRQTFPRDFVQVLPSMLHRPCAVQNCVLVEASTANPGWREVSVRLRDRYGPLGIQSTLTAANRTGRAVNQVSSGC